MNALGWRMIWAGCVAAGMTGGSAQGQTVVVRPAELLQLPGVVHSNTDPKKPGDIDCNSPVHWDGNRMYVFFSLGHPFRSSGPDLAHLSLPSERTTFDNEKTWRDNQQGDRWAEATFQGEGGRLYMWYHNEPHPSCDKAELTAPRIGQMVSTDNGFHWHDQGLILEAPADSLNCATANRYFTGGNGDFSLIPDAGMQYLYFFISTYNKDVVEQGVAVARMRTADIEAPKGKVSKWHQGQWKEPGIGGHVTPVFPVAIDWHKPDADAFWGPAVHWNTHLKQYVMLLNRAKDKEWKQEGIYVSFNADLARPEGWSKPVKVLDAKELEKSKWYPQVVGTDASRRETDKLAGRTTRLFVAGLSKWEIDFLNPGETQPAMPIHCQSP